MKKLSILLISVGGLFLLIAGFLIGFYLQTPTIKMDNSSLSEVVSACVVSGNLSEANGNLLKVNGQSGPFEIPLSDTANIYSFDPRASKWTEIKLNLDDLKAGDKLNIQLNLSPELKLEGRSVMVLPAI